MTTRLKTGEDNHQNLSKQFTGIKCKQKNEYNDKEELEALAIAIKEVHFQDYTCIFYCIPYLHACLDNNLPI
jgi:hypothetical protein